MKDSLKNYSPPQKVQNTTMGLKFRPGHNLVNIGFIFAALFSMYLLESLVANFQEISEDDGDYSGFREGYGLVLDVSFGLIFDRFGSRYPLSICFLLTGFGLFIPNGLASQFLIGLSSVTAICPFIAESIDERF